MRGCLIPSMTFHGQAEEAAAFYTDVFGLTNLGIQYYKDVDFPYPAEAANLVLHCHLQKGDFQLMLADSSEQRTQDMQRGLALTIQCDSDEEVHHIYDILVEHGTMMMEPQDTFWGAKYAKVRDKYGFMWELNADKSE